MRRLIVRVPGGNGQTVADIARECGACDISVATAQDGSDGRLDLVTFNIDNAGLEQVLGRIDDVPDPHVTFDPRGVIALRPPAGQAASQVIEVGPRSPIEVYLSGLQSVGSWRAFLGYAAAAGIVVWIGLYTERIFLLVAAMLIAPFAGPAMNAALATARGDLTLFWRSLLRYVAALSVAILIAFLLSLLFGQKIATGLMVAESQISSVALLLPLVAGGAGALNLCQSERNSLVSGAATGMLVAASLAPPAGIFGIALAIGEWPMVKSAAFLLLLQIAGINIAGAAVFGIYGIDPTGARLKRGRKSMPLLFAGASLVVLAALFTWQMVTSPDLERSSIAQRAAQDVRQLVDSSGLAKAVKVDAQFTRADIPGQHSLLVTGYIQVDKGDGERVKKRLEAAIKDKLRQDHEVDPLADLTVVAP